MSESTQVSTLHLFRRFVADLRRYIIWLTASLVVFPVLGYLYAYYQKAEYAGVATFMIDSGKGGGGVMGGALQLVGQLGLGGMSGLNIDEDKIIEITRSRKIVTTALFRNAEINGHEDNLANHFLEVYDLKKGIAKETGIEDFRFSNHPPKKQEYVTDSLMGTLYDYILANCLEVKKDQKSSILKITCTTRNELLSKYLCNNLLQSITEFYLVNKTSKDRNTLAIVQARIDSIAAALAVAEERYARSKDASSHLVKAQGYVEQLNMKRDVEILNAMFIEGVKNIEVSKFNVLLNTPVIQVIDNPTLPLDKKKLRKLHGLILGGLLAIFLYSGIVLCRRVFLDNMVSDA